MVTPPNNAILAIEIENLKRILADRDEDDRIRDAEIRSLKKWKEHCTLAAAGWGGVCMAIVTIGSLIHSYWDSIKAYIGGLK